MRAAREQTKVARTLRIRRMMQKFRRKSFHNSIDIVHPQLALIDQETIGWRFALGTALIIGGYGAWSLIPVVIEADLEPSAKAFLSGLFGATPFLTKVVAIALMGRPAYNFLKRTVFQWVRRRWSGQP